MDATSIHKVYINDYPLWCAARNIGDIHNLDLFETHHLYITI